MIYTFYSYKGGVGRTMALANVAELFYRAGRKVLMVDWDLEAPGLERFFPIDQEKTLDGPGVMDMLLGYKEQMAHELPASESETAPLPFEKPIQFAVDIYPGDSGKGRLWLLIAGRRSKEHFAEYAYTVRTFDWLDFYQNWEGELYFEWLRQQFEQMADVVLIDSRTGVTEIGGICTYQLADTVVIFCAPNQQSIDGTEQMARNFMDPEVQSLRRGRSLDVLIIPARLERAESPSLNEFQREFVTRFKDFVPQTSKIDIQQLWELGIPYIPKYAYNELVAVRESQASDKDMVKAFGDLVDVMDKLRVKRLPPGILEPGTDLFDYRVLGFVGEGAWAYVYRAQHPKLPMVVAIKQLKPEWTEDEDALQPFLREANIVARLNHPNVVRIFDLKHDEETGRHYIITEFAEKGTLADWLEKLPTGLPIDEVLRLVMGICSGLEAIHRIGVIHRDIKPSNILLFGAEGEPDIPKLSDFGIAKAPAAPGAVIPHSSDAIGSYLYMSPEQFDSETEVDHRSDLYSVGILLYELLTRQVPFTGEVQDVFWAHAYVSPKPPREVRPDIPEELEQVVLRALRKDRKDRYQSAADMYEALRAIEDLELRRERQHRFRDLLRQGLEHSGKGQWEEATEVLRQADILEPGNEQVRKGLQKAHEQQELKRIYALGIQYLQTGDWEEAQECLAQVVARDLDYEHGQAREQLEQATEKLKQERSERDLMVQYRTGMGYFSAQQWERAIAELEQVVTRNSNFVDAADRLEEARRYVQAEQLVEQARRRIEQKEWIGAIDLLEQVEQLRPPHIDIAEELKQLRRKLAQPRHERELTDWYNEGMSQLTAGNLEQARRYFQEIADVQRDYRDVADRLVEMENKIKLEQLFEHASECEAACDYEGAIGTYRAILDIDRYNSKAMNRLGRAQRCAERYARGGLVRLAVKVQNWWDTRDRRAKVALAVLVGVIVVALCGSAAGVASSFLPLPAYRGTATATITPTHVHTSSPTFTLVPALIHTSTSTSTPTPSPTHTCTPLPTLTPTYTSTPMATAKPPTPQPPKPTPKPSYFPPVLTDNSIIGCNVILRWQWSGILAENEWFDIRVWEVSDVPHSQTWAKANEYVWSLSEAGDYVWEVAICRGEPSAASCSGDDELVVSERGGFSFGGCPKSTPVSTSEP